MDADIVWNTSRKWNGNHGDVTPSKIPVDPLGHFVPAFIGKDTVRRIFKNDELLLVSWYLVVQQLHFVYLERLIFISAQTNIEA